MIIDATGKPQSEPTEASKRDKPLLILMRGDANVEELADMLERLKGREPTPEELERARKQLAVN